MWQSSCHARTFANDPSELAALFPCEEEIPALFLLSPVEIGLVIAGGGGLGLGD